MLASYEYEVDVASASSWSEWLDEFEDANIYQTRAYGAVRWGEKNLSHLVLMRGGVRVALAQLRIVRPLGLKCGIAYLRWGPLCHRKGEGLDTDVVRGMASALRKEYAVKRGLFLRLLPNAFQETERAGVFGTAFSDYGREVFRPGESYRTFCLDLEPPLDMLRKNFDQKWRNCLNRAERNGLAIVEGSGPEEFRAFLDVYDQMWARKRFKEGSNVREFEQIQARLAAGHRMHVLLCVYDGAPVAGLVASAMGNSAIYLFGATNEIGMKHKGSYLLHWTLIQRLKQNGVRYYNLGGINPETNPGVYHFKAGFSGRDVLYMPPLTSCKNVVSRGIAQATSIAGGRMRARLNRLLRR